MFLSSGLIAADKFFHRMSIQMCQGSILIGLRDCAGLSESSLGLYVQRWDFWHCGCMYSVGQHIGVGWSGGERVSCILRHRGIQLILAYHWAKPAILVAGKGRGGMFLFFCFFTFIPVPFSYLSLSFISSTISSLFSLSLGDDTKWPTRVDIFSPFLWETTQNDPQGLTRR